MAGTTDSAKPEADAGSNSVLGASSLPAGSTALVTGAAGFIGSRVARQLIRSGVQVVGLDCMDPYYDRTLKTRNLDGLGEGFRLIEADLGTADLAPIVDGVDLIFHVAAQAGVRGSWAHGFGHYVHSNILGTQRLLEASRTTAIRRFVYSSSSSVYGDVSGPVTEDAPKRPRSPYGATKLGGEHLCGAYAREFGVPCVSLRYFTVYGPGQRPDMAIHRMIESALTGSTFPLFGDGSARRDFTFVHDVVSANLCAAVADVQPGDVFNIGGGSSHQVTDVLNAVGSAVGMPVQVQRQERQAGDVRVTAAVTDRAKAHLGWEPATGWNSGIEAQVAWHRSHRDVLAAPSPERAASVLSAHLG